MSDKRRIVTIHGINTDGKWQQRVSEILAPHFDFTAIKYPHYRRLGVIKLISDPWIILLAPILLWCSYRFKWLSSFWELLPPIILLILLALALSFFRRGRALDSVAAQLDSVQKKAPGEKYLIAHSLGTFLSAESIRKYPNLRFHSIILTGCVLTPKFDWAAIQRRGRALYRVLNEVASEDWVSHMAGTLARLIPFMGYAGRFGFAGDPKFVHSIQGPLERCDLCCPPSCGLVHNVIGDEMRHSDHFITSTYAREFWLPFFWNLPPGEFKEFLELCGKCSLAEKQSRFADLEKLERQLRQKEWSFSDDGPITLLAFVRREMDARLRRMHSAPPSEEILQNLADLAIQKIWNIAARADQGQGPPQLLNPILATTAAITQVWNFIP